MNLNTLTGFVGTLTNDINKTRYAAVYTTILNEAQNQFAMDTKCTFKDMTVQSIVAGQATYPLPTDFMWERLVLANGLMLSPISRFELARQNSGSRWDLVTGTPRAYCIDPDVARQQILLYPIPTQNDNGNDLQMTYFALPTAMSSGTDVPLNNNPLLYQYHMGIAAWAAWYMLASEDSTPSIETKKKSLMNMYSDYVSQCVDQFKNTVSEPLRMRGVRNYAFTFGTKP